MSTTSLLPPRRARVAVSGVFAVHGAVYGTFATRVPWIAEHAHAGPGALGLALIAPALGSIATMPLVARFIHRYRSRTVVRILLTAWCLSLVLPALAPNTVVLFISLLVFGACAGTSDVAMNAQGVVVEQRYGRSIMSSLHGLWSAGGLAAASLGALAARANIDARLHFLASAVVLSAVGFLACRRLLDVQLPGEDHPPFALPARPVLLIGLVGFCAVFGEAASGDWSAVYLSSVTGADPGTAALAFTAFAFAMTGARLVGDRVVHRLGAVASVRLGGIVAAAGGVLVLAARVPVLAIVGFTLIGLGVAVVVPLAFTAAGNVGSNPGQAIAGVATIAYGSGLAAPGIIGGIAEVSSLSVSFGVVTLLCVAMALGAAALRPRVAAVVPAQRTGADEPAKDAPDRS